jgi:TonB family protein
MSLAIRRERGFKAAVFFSLMAHLALFLMILYSPSLPGPSKKGMIHYVNLVNLGGGGSGGGSQMQAAEVVAPKRENLSELTTPQKLQERPYSSLRHPVDKPKKEKMPVKEKKAAISQPQKQTTTNTKENEKKVGTATSTNTKAGSGAGLRIGVGEGPGSGSGYASQIGLSTFPYAYYLQIIMDRISANWFTSLVDPGISGEFNTTVYFKIYKNGRISDITLAETSGIRSLDSSAIRAINSSAPFPPLPRDYKEEFLGIHIIFEHSK